MPRTEPSKTQRSKTPEKDVPEQMVRLHWDFSKWMGRDLLETWLDIGSEFQDFLAERIREDVKTQHRILHCTNPADLHKIQAEFVQKAIEDYSAETGRMLEIGKRIFTPSN
jgi:hypothetical protein